MVRKSFGILSILSVLAAVSGFEAGSSDGHPSGRLRNRYFTHPAAADTYLQNRHMKVDTRRKSLTGIILRRGHIYTSDHTQPAGLNLKRGELRTVGEGSGVLIAGPKKGTEHAQQ